MSEALNVNVLVSAKEEYTSQLCFVLSPLIYQGIRSVYIDSQALPKQVRGISYRNYQLKLINVQTWSSFIIEKETKRIKEHCTFLSDLVTAIFVSHVKILACVRLKGNSKNIKIKIPSMENFIHKIYILVAQKFYNNLKLIHEPEENLIQIISDTIMECIRKQLPIEHILREYLFDVFNDVDDSDSKSDSKSSTSKEFNAEDVDEDFDNQSIAETEYQDETKAVPVVPIDGIPIRPVKSDVLHLQPDTIIPNPTTNDIQSDMNPPQGDTTRLQFTDSLMNTPCVQGEPGEAGVIPELNMGHPEARTLEDRQQRNPSGDVLRPVFKRPPSPITLFGDARECEN
jgi:hypothetical protein